MERIKSSRETSNDSRLDTLSNTPEIEKPKACFNSLVTYRYIEDDGRETVYLNRDFVGTLPDAIADVKNIPRGTTAISDQSPIGANIKDKEIGQEINIKSPDGEFKIIIEDIQKV